MPEFDHRDRQIARLREALEGVRYFLNEEQRDDCDCEGCEAARTAIAALSTPTDDWLERHDAEVRQAERERWQRMPNEVQVFKFVHDCIKAYRDQDPPYEAREVEFIAWCLERWTRRDKAAIREGES